MIVVTYNGQEFNFMDGTNIEQIRTNLISHVGGLDNNARLNADPSVPNKYTLVPGPQTKG